MIKKIVIIFLLATALLQAQSPNSGSDPQLAELESRESAEMPVPFGVIVSAMNPIYNTEVELRGFTSLAYDFMLYYDTWQLGYAHKEYGDAFMLMARTFGRDDYGGLYFEYGNSTDFQTKSKEDSGITKDEFGKFPFYGIGLHGQSGFDSSFSWSGYWDIAFGVYAMDESPKYFNLEVGFGMRLPISTTAVYLHLIGFFYRNPNVEFPITENIKYDDNDWRFDQNVGIKVRMSLGLNFQH
jgi:hypothetical protein